MAATGLFNAVTNEHETAEGEGQTGMLQSWFGSPVKRSRSSRLSVRRRGFPSGEFRFEQLESRQLLAVLTDVPLVGGVTSDQARVFLRTDEAASVSVEYSTSASFASSLLTPAEAVSASGDFTALVAMTGLVPSTTYYYRAVIDGVSVQDGVTRSFSTFAAAGVPTEFSFALTSDLKNAGSNPTVGVPSYASIAAEQPAFMMQLGDFDHRNPQTLAAMRTMHRQLRSPGVAAGDDFAQYIAPQIPLVHIWDDHDFGENNSDKNFPGKSDSLQAFAEYYPTTDRPNAAGIWHSFQHGIAEFFMLDVRSHATRQPMLMVRKSRCWTETKLPTTS